MRDQETMRSERPAGQVQAYGGEGAKPEPAKPKPAEKPKDAPKPAPKSQSSAPNE